MGFCTCLLVAFCKGVEWFLLWLLGRLFNVSLFIYLLIKIVLFYEASIHFNMVCTIMLDWIMIVKQPILLKAQVYRILV